jgi:hypothetical protein
MEMVAWRLIPRGVKDNLAKEIFFGVLNLTGPISPINEDHYETSYLEEEVWR